jgi:hypothetical protein
MISRVSKLSEVTLGHVWSMLWRGLAWVMAIIITAMLLDLDWSWKLLVLCFASDIANFVFYQYARPTSSDS